MIKTQRSVKMKVAAILLVGTMVTSSMCGLVAFANEEESGYATVTNTLEADPVYVGETITIEEEPVVEFEGTITDDNPTYEFIYTAPRDGQYYFGIEDVKESCIVSFSIYDSYENKISNYMDNIYKLEESETYTITISKLSGNTPFILQIKAQKATADISDYSIVNDQIVFTYQENNYTFTAENSGLYCFVMCDTPINIKFRVLMWSQYDTSIYDKILGSGDYITAELEKGESYWMQIVYSPYSGAGTGSYTLQIQAAKPTVEITGFTEIHDSFEYEGQENCYALAAPVEGNYYIGINNTFDKYYYYIYDEVGNKINNSLSSSGVDGIKVYLEENKEYTVMVEQVNGYGDYTLEISYPSTAQEYLENSAAGNTSTASVTSADESEAEGTSDETASADSSQTDILQQQIDELQSELEDMQEENDRLKEILEENEIVYD